MGGGLLNFRKPFVEYSVIQQAVASKSTLSSLNSPSCAREERHKKEETMWDARTLERGKIKRSRPK